MKKLNLDKSDYICSDSMVMLYIDEFCSNRSYRIGSGSDGNYGCDTRCGIGRGCSLDIICR